MAWIISAKTSFTPSCCLADLKSDGFFVVKHGQRVNSIQQKNTGIEISRNMSSMLISKCLNVKSLGWNYELVLKILED